MEHDHGIEEALITLARTLQDLPRMLSVATRAPRKIEIQRQLKLFVRTLGLSEAESFTYIHTAAYARPHMPTFDRDLSSYEQFQRV